jgi:hypothetical protein
VEEMVTLMADSVSKGAVVIVYGMVNAIFNEENEEGDRAFRKADKEGHYHVAGWVEVASPRQVKGLMRNCAPIYDKIKNNKKVILSPL